MEKSLLFLIALSVFTLAVTSSHVTFNVLDYGAIGDGRNDDTKAFLRTWEETCKVSSPSSTMEVPSGKTFLIHPLEFEGRCNKEIIIVEINGNILAPSEPSEWRCDGGCFSLINFKHVDNLTIRGHGVINGRGNKWWSSSRRLDRKPNALRVGSANNVTLSGLTFKDVPHMHLILDGLTSSHVSNLTLDNPEDSPNTDGIHITECTDLTVEHCHIGTGDDCISIVSGSSHVKINNIICGPGHGISIGSLGKGGSRDTVEYVEVRDVVFIRTMNGARIKTWQGGRGYARHMIFERILSHEASRIINIDQFYCDGDHSRCEAHDASSPIINNITFNQVLGTSSTHNAVNLECSKSVPCTDIILNDIYILSRNKQTASVTCNENVHGKAQGMMVPQISCLNIQSRI